MKKRFNMLTQDQLQKLELLTNHPRYGHLLSDAIEIWKTKAKPEYGSFGIFFNEETKQFEITKHKKCCLIGASLVNFKCNIDDFNQCFSSGLNQKYDLSLSEFESLYSGFDDLPKFDNHVSDAFDFGKKVRESLAIDLPKFIEFVNSPLEY